MRKLLVIIYILALKAEAQSSALDIGNDLFAKGNYTKAVKAYLEYNDSTAVFDKIAKSYMALGLTNKAVLYYEKSFNAFPDNELIMYNYAKILLSTKQYNKASHLFEKLIYKDYKNPNYHYQKGLVLEKMKDSMEKAIDRFNSAFRLDNSHQKSIVKLAKYYIKKRRHQSVDFYVDRGLEYALQSPSLHSLKAQNYYYKEDYAKAIVWFEKLIALGESSEFIHEKLSLSYGHEYEYKKAIEQRKKVLEYNAMDAVSMYVIGQYYQRLNNHEEAEKWITKYLKLSDIPLDAEYTNLGMSYNYQKKYKEAIDAFKTALKEDSNNISAQFFLVRTKDEFYKDIDAKIKLYKDFKDKYPKSPFLPMAEMRLSELKKEKFLDQD
ncbi:tetratricopeptide repeat protein [Ichthyenterobacterium sp. W332]|uniref:Tetratricopeptide repeat protein n=1 Tax=Microcosmobacter mediterraneus TaxID=3075607 RepID=A0ABU2YMP2_9FLAO|nr:tetratricopeptide repeat protein [Ichthyenterobacterium sp. W332]MDT0558959.1 tetratricopeptide repeat protein [Ichthyenterobacterium sp. W332]